MGLRLGSLSFNDQLILVASAVTVIETAPPTKPLSDVSITTTTQRQPVEEIQLVQPHFITIESLETLLKHAGEIFRPESYQFEQAKTEHQAEGSDKLHKPHQQMQPPLDQPYSFYLPLYDYVNDNLDEKSRNMEKLVPPPLPSDNINYYATKPKKLPKKFNAETKQVNLKWLNKYETEALTDSSRHLPEGVYVVNDERSRINFDDSFFGEDVAVKFPDNQPHRTLKKTVSKTNADGYLNMGEELSEEDLLAVPALQFPNVSIEGKVQH
ncbi:uncharacterized protein LOC119673975 [Teleopsis dalmanni]|uniref:uncharacterized protein LOC119673975 n=1 Tax=Teleopsis dalmanni TaxID=139649 RepID=UPI0018CDC03A|nr:uncharacterized protein LOC119673975 [Teleopsis dalmanni]